MLLIILIHILVVVLIDQLYNFTKNSLVKDICMFCLIIFGGINYILLINYLKK